MATIFLVIKHISHQWSVRIMLMKETWTSCNFRSLLLYLFTCFRSVLVGRLDSHCVHIHSSTRRCLRWHTRHCSGTMCWSEESSHVALSERPNWVLLVCRDLIAMLKSGRCCCVICCKEQSLYFCKLSADYEMNSRCFVHLYVATKLLSHDQWRSEWQGK